MPAAVAAPPDVALAPWLAAMVFGLFIIIALSAGLVFHISTVALPKLVDERLGGNVPLILVGGIATLIFVCGGLAQLAVGRLVEKFPLHILFAGCGLLQFPGVAWAAYASGISLLVALSLAMAAIYAQVTVNDLVIARYTADAWRGRVYALRYFLTFVVAGVAVSTIAFLHARGGFDLVLGVTAIVALGFVFATILIAILVSGVEKERATRDCSGRIAPFRSAARTGSRPARQGLRRSIRRFGCGGIPPDAARSRAHTPAVRRARSS